MSRTDSLLLPADQTHPELMLQVGSLNVYYGESHILRDVDLSVPSGQMVCLIGRNGSAEDATKSHHGAN